MDGGNNSLGGYYFYVCKVTQMGQIGSLERFSSRLYAYSILDQIAAEFTHYPVK